MNEHMNISLWNFNQCVKIEFWVAGADVFTKLLPCRKPLNTAAKNFSCVLGYNPAYLNLASISLRRITPAHKFTKLHLYRAYVAWNRALSPTT